MHYKCAVSSSLNDTPSSKILSDLPTCLFFYITTWDQVTDLGRVDFYRSGEGTTNEP